MYIYPRIRFRDTKRSNSIPKRCVHETFQEYCSRVNHRTIIGIRCKGHWSHSFLESSRYLLPKESRMRNNTQRSLIKKLRNLRIIATCKYTDGLHWRKMVSPLKVNHRRFSPRTFRLYRRLTHDIINERFRDTQKQVARNDESSKRLINTLGSTYLKSRVFLEAVGKRVAASFHRIFAWRRMITPRVSRSKRAILQVCVVRSNDRRKFIGNERVKKKKIRGNWKIHIN